MAKDGSSSTKSSLLEQVKSWENQDSWGAFFHIYRPLIYKFSMQSGLTHDEAQEVAQETLIEVAQRIKEGEYDRKQGTFRSWLFRLSRWRVINQLNERRQNVVSLEQTTTSGDEELEQLESLDESSAIWEKEWRQSIFDAALEQLRHRMKPKHFQVLNALYCRGWSPAEVAKTLHMSRGQIYLIKLRGVVQLKKQMERLERAQI